MYARDISFTASALLEYFPGACATDVHAIPSIQPDWGPRLKLEIIVKTPLRPAWVNTRATGSNGEYFSQVQATGVGSVETWRCNYQIR